MKEMKNEGCIILHRVFDIDLLNVTLAVNIDGVIKAQVENGDTIRMPINVGKHELYVHFKNSIFGNQRSNKINIYVKKNHEVNVECGSSYHGVGKIFSGILSPFSKIRNLYVNEIN